MHSCAACLSVHRPSAKKQCTYFWKTKLAIGDLGDCAANCNVNNKGEKKRKIIANIVPRPLSGTTFNKS